MGRQPATGAGPQCEVRRGLTTAGLLAIGLLPHELVAGASVVDVKGPSLAAERGKEKSMACLGERP